MACAPDSQRVRVQASRLARAVPWFLIACLASACGLGHEVEQAGSYVIVPPTAVTDSAPYPLKSLLYVERDMQLEQTRLYLFRGELRKADLGLEDLRRILARRNGFQMAFDAVPRKFESDTVKSHGKPLAARVGDDTLELARLDDKGLKQSGAQRYLASVATSDYDVAAYFGVFDGAASDASAASIAIDRAGIDYAPEDAPPELEPALDLDAMKLALKYRAKADFLVVELGQPIQRRMEEAEMDAGVEDAKDAGAKDAGDEDVEDTTVDALVRTTLAPASEYAVTPSLLTDVAGKGCWSRERPVQARLHQVSRRYQQQDQGDWAVVYDRIDTLELGVEAWTALLGEPKAAAYCADFE